MWRARGLWLVLLLAGCRQQMADQPKYTPMEASRFFADGQSARPLVPGTVPRGTSAAKESPVLTRALLLRGQERYDIYCSPCHGLAGYGDGMIVQRGFPHPPSLHDPRLRAAPPEHFYRVITEGFGVMYSYADRVEPADRWAIAAYVRALQLSQHARVEDVPPAERRQLGGRP